MPRQSDDPARGRRYAVNVGRARRMRAEDRRPRKAAVSVEERVGQDVHSHDDGTSTAVSTNDDRHTLLAPLSPVFVEMATLSYLLGYALTAHAWSESTAWYTATTYKPRTRTASDKFAPNTAKTPHSTAQRPSKPIHQKLQRYDDTSEERQHDDRARPLHPGNDEEERRQARRRYEHAHRRHATAHAEIKVRPIHARHHALHNNEEVVSPACVRSKGEVGRLTRDARASAL